jgi:NAD(P)-dependent dehydrogenase (short-subunit alcohol dehydrogenase family)
MSGTQILVTGSTDGIGRQTAIDLARLGADVVVHGRTREKAEETAAALGAALQRAPLLAVAGDLSSLNAVRALAADVLARAPRLSVVIHNAGVLEKQRHVTADGHELTFAVNHLAPFLLTHLLLDRLKERAPSRIVNVSSGLHGSGHIDFDDLQMSRGFDGVSAYSASKLANVLFTNELARRLGSTDVGVYALHPGVISTKLLHRGFGTGGGSVEEGARTSVFAATDPSLAGRTALYLANARVATSAAIARDPEIMRRLYDESCRLTEIAGLPG